MRVSVNLVGATACVVSAALTVGVLVPALKQSGVVEDLAFDLGRAMFWPERAVAAIPGEGPQTAPQRSKAEMGEHAEAKADRSPAPRSRVDVPGRKAPVDPRR